jgi:hypothetical protein
MAHKTLINGTAYSISGGKTLVNGTAYSIKNGKTLVDGTAYGINFAPSTAIITITGIPHSRYADGSCSKVTINGTVYDANSVSASGGSISLEVPVGSEILCKVGYNNATAQAASTHAVKINGETQTLKYMSDSTDGAYAGGYYYYNYTVKSNATMVLEDKEGLHTVGGFMKYYTEYGTITITEQ